VSDDTKEKGNNTDYQLLFLHGLGSKSQNCDCIINKAVIPSWVGVKEEDEKHLYPRQDVKDRGEWDHHVKAMTDVERH